MAKRDDAPTSRRGRGAASVRRSLAAEENLLGRRDDKRHDNAGGGTLNAIVLRDTTEEVGAVVVLAFVHLSDPIGVFAGDIAGVEKTWIVLCTS